MMIEDIIKLDIKKSGKIAIKHILKLGLYQPIWNLIKLEAIND